MRVPTDHPPPMETEDDPGPAGAGEDPPFSPAPGLEGILPGTAMRLAVAVQAFTHNVVLGADIRFSSIEAELPRPRAEEAD